MRDKTVNGDYIELHLNYDEEPEEKKVETKKPTSNPTNYQWSCLIITIIYIN